MRISFVIPAHNEALLLPATIASIHAAARACGEEPEHAADYEIIVADDASTDATAEIARAAGARVVSHDRRQIAATRNLGARAATGDLLVFVDADTRITPASLDQAIDAVRAGAAGGGSLPRFDGRIPAYATAMLWMLCTLFRLARITGGCFVFCTRDAYLASGGWDESLYAGEEIEFIRALKRRGRFVVLRARVITSGRKLRTYSAREILGASLRLALAGRPGLRDRAHLDLWYAPRRTDPAAPISPDPEPPPALDAQFR